MDTAVIIVAAGDGTRLGAGRPKALVELAGRSILERCLTSVLAMEEEVQVVVVAPPAAIDEAVGVVRRVSGLLSDGIDVVPGAGSRTASVRAGLGAVRPTVKTVLVHDAARALAPSHFLSSIARLVRSSGESVVPGLPVTDTIKRVDDVGAVTATVDRDALRAVQTPQGFPRSVIERAYERADDAHTDDAATVAALGEIVRIVPGHELAFKITTPWDLRRAELLLAPAIVRTGVGTDVHGFAEPTEQRPLRLAGLEWPGERRLSGHSDGDAVAHAIVDALLGAAGLGDIGSMFGTADPRFADAHGDAFLRGAIDAIAAAGFEAVNVSVQVIGNRPRFAARRTEAERVLSALVGAPVSVSATTTDGLGFTGRGEGIAVIATALVRTRLHDDLE